MKHIFLPFIVCLVLTKIHVQSLLGMENQLSRSESIRLTQMENTLNDNTRIGPLTTLIIAKHIKESYFSTLIKAVKTHPYIKTEEKITEKSYTCKYSYNPLTFQGLCPNDTTQIALAFAKILQIRFIPETERNNLNDYFFDTYDKPNDFQQVDFCVSAKYVLTGDYYEYIARFFNKEALLNTIQLFDPAKEKNS
ncbi:hypothetical protein EKK58_04795 [Candidatus Dependentiae bacterium]|nr:MAG: hypothetical protein EKK58_04795 [Candidatus Dependentiae bacterium]